MSSCQAYCLFAVAIAALGVLIAILMRLRDIHDDVIRIRTVNTHRWARRRPAGDGSTHTPNSGTEASL